MSFDQCYNNTDPISLDDLDPNNFIIIDIDEKRNKGHCFSVESLAEYIKTKTESGSKIIKNPVNPNYILSDNEKKIIINKMKVINPSWTEPVYNSKLKTTLSTITSFTQPGQTVQPTRYSEEFDSALISYLSEQTNNLRNEFETRMRVETGQNRPATLLFQPTPPNRIERRTRNFKPSPVTELAKKLEREREDNFKHVTVTREGEKVETNVFLEEDNNYDNWQNVYKTEVALTRNKRTTKVTPENKPKTQIQATSKKEKYSKYRKKPTQTEQPQIQPKPQVQPQIQNTEQTIKIYKFLRGENGLKNNRENEQQNVGPRIYPIQEQFEILSKEIKTRWSKKQIIITTVVIILVIILCFWLRRKFFKKK